ncbi:MAG: phosphoglycerate kinase [Armatimonadota bacterium]
MEQRTVRDITVSRQRVLVRADLNVPLENGTIADDTRIRAALPTIRYLLDQDARVILCSHLDRPKGKVVEELRLNPVAERLADLLEHEVSKVDDCVGTAVSSAVDALKPGGVLLLENTRFHAEEKENDHAFAQQLAALADIYVNDAFAAAHRAHASTEGVAHFLPAVAGLLMAREVEALTPVRDGPAHPVVVVMGGAKVEDKLEAVRYFSEWGDTVLVGGGLANTFLAATGVDVGKSLVGEDTGDEAGAVLQAVGDRLRLPTDAVVAEALEPGADYRFVNIEDMPADWAIADIGPDTLKLFTVTLETARTILWNGPMGIFEMEPFRQGTTAIARAMAESDATTVVGGGDTLSAVRQIGVLDRFTHVSTGGGAFLEFMMGHALPGIAALQAR